MRFTFLISMVICMIFGHVLLKITDRNKIISQQVNFLKDLMNGFNVYKNIMKPKGESDYKAENLYKKLLGAPNKNVDEILFLKSSMDQYKKEFYLKAKMLFDLRKDIIKKLSNKGIIKNYSDQSDKKEYKKYIAERVELRGQELEVIEKKEEDINNYLFKKYFTNYESPSDMYNRLSDAKKTKEHNIRINLIKSTLIDLKKDIKNTSKDDVDKIEETNK